MRYEKRTTGTVAGGPLDGARAYVLGYTRTGGRLRVCLLEDRGAYRKGDPVVIAHTDFRPMGTTR